MKKIILVLVVLAFGLQLQAQDRTAFIDPKIRILDSIRSETLKNAPYIFEGKIVKEEIYCEDFSALFHIIYYVDITRIFRGGEQLQYGTVEVVDPLYYGPWSPINTPPTPKKHYNRRFEPNSHGLFFCRPNATVVPVSDAFSTSNRLRLQTYSKHTEHTFYRYHPGFRTHNDWQHYNLMWKGFETHKEMCTYMQKFDNIKVPRQRSVYRRKRSIPQVDTAEQNRQRAERLKLEQWLRSRVATDSIKKKRTKRGASPRSST